MKSVSAGLAIVTFGLLGAVAARASEPAAKAPVPAADPAKAPAAPAKPAGPPEVAWKDMTKQQKGKFMKEVVVPKLKPVFTAFDSTEFKKFDCATCHGKDAKAHEFKMPSSDVFPLPATKEGFAELMQKKPRFMKFMAETVKPQMAALLGLPELNPQKPEAGGFGCQACHTTKK
jgi:hypothetical protein